MHYKKGSLLKIEGNQNFPWKTTDVMVEFEPSIYGINVKDANHNTKKTLTEIRKEAFYV